MLPLRSTWILVWMLLGPWVVLAGEDAYKEPWAPVDASVNAAIDEAYQAQVKPIFEQKCYDCHVTDPDYPWYVQVPGLGALMRHHNEEGVKDLDLTNGFPFGGEGGVLKQLREIEKEVLVKREMPPTYYLITHPSAGLDGEEKAQLAQWIQWTRQQLAH
ncbi:MAG: heme-binding domain-containing protein [bacterium]|nr:heme-binding domain-containing protein [bacterium]